MADQIEVMILDDEQTVVDRLRDFLQGKGMVVETFTESQTAVQRINEKRFDVVVTDLKMIAPDGIDVLVFVKKQSPTTQVILISGFGSIETVRMSEFSGAYAFVHKPFRMEEILKLVKKAAKKARR